MTVRKSRGTDKRSLRRRRVLRLRRRARAAGVCRLCVHRTPRHVYAQVLNAEGVHTLVSASSLDKALRGELKDSGNIAAARQVGDSLARQAIAAGIRKVVFDRSGFSYHGRVRALADAARAGGMEF